MTTNNRALASKRVVSDPADCKQAPRRLGAFITGRYYEEDVQLTFRSGVLTKRPNGDGEMTYTSPAVRAQLEPWKLSDAKIRLSPEAQTATRGPQMRLEMAWRGREDPEDYIVSFELTEDQYKRLTRGPSAGFTQRAREMYRSDTVRHRFFVAYAGLHPSINGGAALRPRGTSQHGDLAEGSDRPGNLSQRSDRYSCSAKESERCHGLQPLGIKAFQ